MAQGLIAAAVFTSALSGTAFAGEACADDEVSVIAADDTAGQLRQEIVGYRYVLKDGIWYRRLWSYTYGKWLEDEWTPVP